MSEPTNATRFAEPVPKFGAMSDAELALFIAENERDQIVITEEMRVDLEAGQPRGARWRQAAGRAKGYKVANLKLARAEEARRAPQVNKVEEKAKKLEYSFFKQWQPATSVIRKKFCLLLDLSHTAHILLSSI